MLPKQTKMKFSAVLTAVIVSLGVTHSAVSLDLAQSPLFLSNGAEPNLMFILDDSGSMQFEITPEDYRKDAAFVFPLPKGNVYGTAALNTGNHGTATVDDEVAFTALTRSPQINKSYYNPSVTYTPWVEYDGTSYPDAVPTCALHNPEATSGSCPTGDSFVTEYARNLTIDNSRQGAYSSWKSCNSGGGCSTSWDDKSFWPATYFWHTGGSEWNWNSYEPKVEIRSGTATYTGHGRDKRTDCANGTCTYAQEIQNFANWYTYYRSRVLAARAGIGHAFAEQGEAMRVGFGALNNGLTGVDGVNTQTIKSGVRTFSGDNRKNFFDQLYTQPVNASGTPLRRALDDAGQYFSRTNNSGPWGTNPGSNDDSDQLACRASYTILMTDGYWNGTSNYTDGAEGNVDGNAGSQITGPGGKSYTYEAASPFSDSRSNTLADVAMYYWNRDLHSGLENSVPAKTGSINPAFWQNMVTYGVGFGVQGTVDKDMAFAAIGAGTAIDWPNPNNSNSAKIDDLLHAAVNSRGGFFSAADPQSFASELSKVLEDIIGRSGGSAASVAANSTRLGTDTMVYQAKFNSESWTGTLTAQRLNYIEATEEDERNRVQLGEVSWTTSNSDFASPRTIGTSVINGNGNKVGAVFTWANLTDAQKALLNGDDGNGESVVNWVRGEDVSGLRPRTSKLGDVVNSSPVYSGKTKYNFSRLPAYAGGPTYLTYYTEQKNIEARKNVVYVGANDGMLHAFDAENGDELFAYVPTPVLGKLKSLSAANYGDGDNPHTYTVDGPIFVGDAYIGDASGGSWKNILVGTMGAGGKGLFVLDVTDPANFDPATDVLFEITEADMPEIGNITGQPIVAPTLDGWKIFVGNGYNSPGATEEVAGRAVLLVIDLKDPFTESVRIPVGDAGDTGLAGPSLLSNGAGLVVKAYAGDLQGNMWRFNLTSTAVQEGVTVVNWGASAQLLFTARDSGGRVQPITAPPVLGVNEQRNNATMVYFGTGSYLTSADKGLGSTVHSVYALTDLGATIASRDALFQKQINSETDTTRQVSNDDNTTWWTSKSGWYLDLSSTGSVTGERVVSKPLLEYDRLLFPTLIPSNTACESGASGWEMELKAVGDKHDTHSIFGEDGIKSDYAVVGYTNLIKKGDDVTRVDNNYEGDMTNKDGEKPVGAHGRMSWRQIR